MSLQKRLAAKILKCGPSRIKLDPAKLSEIKEAITTFDIKRLIKKKIVKKEQEKGVSRGRAKKRAAQRRKGRQKGHGSRKGKVTARAKPKQVWMNKARAQRTLLKKLKEKNYITNETFRTLYSRVKGGYFRSTSHIKMYLQEHHLIQNNEKKNKK